MSIQFGRWNSDGKPIDQTYLAKVKPIIAPYGPDDEGAYAISNVSILYRAFHTTKESRRETQPHVSGSGVVITWDGRLDNRAELIRCLRDVLTISATDVSIVAAAYEEWGTNCFARLVGDGRSPSGTPIHVPCSSRKIPSARAISIIPSTATKSPGAQSSIHSFSSPANPSPFAKSTSPAGSRSSPPPI